MSDARDLRVECSDQDLIVGAVNRLMPLLDKDLRDQLNGLKRQVFVQSGKPGLFEAMAGKTVGEILDSIELTMTPIKSGQLGQTKYSLYESKTEDRPQEKDSNSR